MQVKFDIVKISASMAERTIELTMSREVDDSTVSRDVIALAEKASERVVPCTFEFAGSRIIMRLLEWPTANTSYTLLVQRGIKSVIGEELAASIQRNIVFESQLTSGVVVTRPVQFERVDGLSIAWRETGDVLAGEFYYEVATDNTFSNVVYQGIIDRSEVAIADVPDGDYCLRVRAQKGTDVGTFSEPVSFVVGAAIQGGINPIILRDIDLLEIPEAGETPDAFRFILSAAINADTAPLVSLTRRFGASKETVAAEAVINGREITVSPVAPAVIENDSYYDIRIYGVEADGYRVPEPISIAVMTAPSLLYAPLQSVTSLLGEWDVPKETLLLFINDASKYVKYLMPYGTVDPANVSFEVSQFVKYRAAKEALLSTYMARAQSIGKRGKLGEVEFENSNTLPGLTSLLKFLDDEQKIWQDAVRGYGPEGRNKPTSAQRSSKSTATGPLDTLTGDVTRRTF